MRLFIYGVSILVLGICGCNNDKPISPEIEKLGRATGPVDPAMSKMAMPPAVKPDGRRHIGNVQETIDVPNYTYIRFKTPADETVWAAVPTTKIENATDVEIIESIVMKDFTSPTLGRTFKTIIFGVLAGKKDETKDEKPAAATLPNAPEDTSFSDDTKQKTHEHPQGIKPAGMMDRQKLPAGHPPINGS